MKNHEPLETPILFLIFNRPDVTQLAFNAIRKARPKVLYVRADGPRADRAGEAESCQKTRDILKQVDWDCEVKTSFSDTNLGCRRSVSMGLNWFFENVEQGIILEDDCVPSESFFPYCQEMLNRYRDDLRIMQICGTNYLFGKKKFKASYYFTKINDITGWATWRRAWNHFHTDMNTFPEFVKEKQLANYIEDPEIADWLMSYFEDTYYGGRNVWSPQWTYAMAIHNGLTIAPSVNLVENVGFREDSTNAVGNSNRYHEYASTKAQNFKKLVHPEFILADREADRIRFELVKRTDPRLEFKNRLKRKVKGILREKGLYGVRA